MYVIPEKIFLFISLPIIISYLISTLCFTRISMKHIEKKMREEGIHEPLWDKGIGIRVTMYGKVIRRQKPAKATVVNDEAILRHARPIDLILARVMHVSFLGLMLIIAYGYFAYDLGEGAY
ncbi:hypothetical protein [uncultured Pseudoalteromonas sp.]|uniref:hypothetical protein n=4 Tax=Pseudoalteromonas TaxID=53246 RepID=UPI002626BD61|nr:hypothetical protein [uncultured Pseudoalteromonas sp.]MED5513135.1 hypothetical protein [Pseudomonadota bacterium]|tara:strand:- start:596 stop:958 length:363 start_codon:yes stop_codon:yes gene_type:complete